MQRVGYRTELRLPPVSGKKDDDHEEDFDENENDDIPLDTQTPTILDQIESARSFVETIGTRAETRAYQELVMTLTSAGNLLLRRVR